MTLQEQSREMPTGIARDYYRSDEVFEEELEKVFGTQWLLVAHESEISEPGDYVTRQMGRDPVIVARDEKGTINVLLNSCTHRGTQVCKASAGNSASFICGYHGWMFGNNGDLKGVPGRVTLYSRDFDMSKHGLRKARVGTAHGFVFATWSHDGPSLEEHLGEYDWYLGALFDFFPGGMEIYGGIHRVVIRANWKIHTDNFSGDGYHLRIAHRTMFEMGVVGEQAKEAAGWLVTVPQGHSLRCQYVKDPAIENTVFGYPEELLADASASASEDVLKFRTAASVIHGAMFPNSVLITTAPVTFGTDAQGQTAFYQVRMFNPIDAHHHEVVYFTLVPKDAPQEWKDRSYLYSIRQHGASSFFEADDLENFRRIDAGVAGLAGDELPFNYELGIGVDGGAPAPWNGPATIVSQDFSENNQRNFIRRYLDVMGVDR